MVVWYSIILGLFIGSFLNVLADRLPKGQNVLWGRSHCDYCKKTLRWYELIPVVSFILQGAKCRRCHKKLSWQYPLIELATAIGFGSIAANQSSVLALTAGCIIYSSFVVMMVADFKFQIIPDSMIVMAIIGVALLLAAQPLGMNTLVHLGIAVGIMLFFYLLWLFTHGRGIGFGDVKLSFVLGLLLGFPEAIIALYIAFLTGAMVGVILILRGRKTLKSKIAFGPFLIGATGAVFLFHAQLLHLWSLYL